MLSIIGCGNTNRSDDGVGIYVVQALIESLGDRYREHIRLFDAGTSGMDVMFQARGSDALIVVDANQSNSKPGTIFEVPGEELESIPEPSYNLHDFRWDNALYAGKRIYQDDFPNDIKVFLIEAQNLELGISLSDSVKNSADRVVALITENIERYLDQR